MAATATAHGINFDLTGALALHRNLTAISSQLPTIEQRALGTLRRRLPVEAKRDIVRQYNIKQSRVDKDLKITSTPLGMRLLGHWRNIGRMNFGARQVQSGVSYSIFLGVRKISKGSFIVGFRRGTTPKGNMHVARRTTKARLPLETKYGPTVAQMLGKEGRPERLEEFAVGVLTAELERLVASAINQGAATGGTK